MTEMNLIEFQGEDYYNAAELHEKDPSFFYGCR